MAIRSPDYSDVYKDCPVVKTLSTSITTTGTATVWTPASGKRFRLKYISIVSAISTTLAGTGVQLNFYDNAVGGSALIWPIAVFAANQAAFASLTTGSPILLPTPGILSAAANNALIIGCDATISTGKIQLAVVVGGTEE